MAYESQPLRIEPHIQITVRRSAREHLSKFLDAKRDMLVFVWGMHGLQSDPGWTASVVDREDLPNSANACAVLKTTIGSFPVGIPQRQHLQKLDGCTLACDGDQLKVEVSFESWLNDLKFDKVVE
ncbi:MAG: hypothetical protein OET44_16020 [Gammaproteobacteria bacterium]|nr:hypothetical protein [Gammaproteobacteria bacterium]